MPLIRAVARSGQICTRSPAARPPSSKVPVATVPAPLMLKVRSIHIRGRPRSWGECPTKAAERPSATSPSPRVRGADTLNTGQPAAMVPDNFSVISISTREANSSSTRSVLVRATTPLVTSSRSSTARCSSDWGIQPSLAATRNSDASMASMPASMFLMKRS